MDKHRAASDQLSAFFRQLSAGEVVLHVKVTPRSAMDVIEGVETRADGKSHLRVRVRAAPEDGKANAAVTRLLAKQLNIPAGSVKVAGGEASRMKTLTISGEAERLASALLTLAVPGGK